MYTDYVVVIFSGGGLRESYQGLVQPQRIQGISRTCILMKGPEAPGMYANGVTYEVDIKII